MNPWNIIGWFLVAAVILAALIIACGVILAAARAFWRGWCVSRDTSGPIEPGQDWVGPSYRTSGIARLRLQSDGRDSPFMFMAGVSRYGFSGQNEYFRDIREVRAFLRKNGLTLDRRQP